MSIILNYGESAKHFLIRLAEFQPFYMHLLWRVRDPRIPGGHCWRLWLQFVQGCKPVISRSGTAAIWWPIIWLVLEFLPQTSYDSELSHHPCLSTLGSQWSLRLVVYGQFPNPLNPTRSCLLAVKLRFACGSFWCQPAILGEFGRNETCSMILEWKIGLNAVEHCQYLCQIRLSMTVVWNQMAPLSHCIHTQTCKGLRNNCNNWTTAISSLYYGFSLDW